MERNIRPVTETIIIGLSCNEKCYFCNTDKFAENYCKTPLEIEQKLDEYRSKGLTDIQVTGGEPTIMPHFFKTLKLASEKGFVGLGIQTNAITSYYPSFVEKLKNHNVSSAFASLHSHIPQVHDQITRVPNSFKYALQGIKNLLNADIDVTISLVVNLLNYPYLVNTIEFFAKEIPNIRTVTISFVSPNAHGWENRWIIPKMSEVAPHIRESLEKSKKLNINCQVSDYCGLPLCFLEGYEIFSDTYYYANNSSGQITMRHDRIKPHTCELCKWFSKCTGIWDNYEKIHGTDELKPVKDLKKMDEKTDKKPIKIHVGLACNNSCDICKYKLDSETRNTLYQNQLYKSLENIKLELNNVTHLNQHEVIFHGGEPTIHQDILRIINHAKKKGFKDITLATNGRMMSNKSFVDKLHAAGMNKAIINISGHTSKIHDFSTKTKGSFDQTMTGIDLLSNTNIETNIDIIINNHNYKFLKEIISMLSKYDITEINIVYPLWFNGDPNTQTKIPEYPTLLESESYISKAIKSVNQKTRLWVHNVPFCYLDGFEKYSKTNSDKTVTKIKSQICNNCKYSIICNGISTVHLMKKNRNAFRAIEGKKYTHESFKRFISSSSEEISPTKKVELNIGLACNNDCQFCISGIKSSTLDSTENIKSEIGKYKGEEIDLLNILGGEPTLLKDLPEIIKYAKDMGFKSIQIITNGRNLSNREYTKKLLQNGLDRISVTIHGHNPELQDEIVQRKYSFHQTVQGIINIIELRKELNKNVRLTCGTCINKLNYKYLKDISRVVFDLGVDEHLLININPDGNCNSYFDKIVATYEQIIPYVKEVSEYCKLKEYPLAITGFPHCLVQGFVDFQDEDIYQTDEANIMSDDNSSGRKKFNWIKSRNSFKTKIEECNLCIYNLRCEGVWKKYVEKFGVNCFKPIKIEK